MKMVYLLGTLLFASLLQAKVLVSPIEVMQEHFGAKATISKKNVLLNKAQANKVQKIAKTKLGTKIYRIFFAKNGDEVLGYGVLVNQKVRSKNAVMLYIIQNDTLQSMEVIAFNEPLEYVPSKEWSKQFHNIQTDKHLQLNRDIPTITGATLSARSAVNGSNIALAIYRTLFKK